MGSRLAHMRRILGVFSLQKDLWSLLWCYWSPPSPQNYRENKVKLIHNFFHKTEGQTWRLGDVNVGLSLTCVILTKINLSCLIFELSLSMQLRNAFPLINSKYMLNDAETDMKNIHYIFSTNCPFFLSFRVLHH